MRILHCIADLGFTSGGLHFSVSGLAKAQLALGHTVDAMGAGTNSSAQEALQWGGINLFNLHAKNKYGLDLNAFKHIKKRTYDIVHIHGIWNAVTLYGLFALIKSIPVVVSPRGMLAPYIRDKSPYKKAVHGNIFEKTLLKHAHIHALSETEASHILNFSPSKKSVVSISNGIDAIERKQIPQGSNALFLGRLAPQKQPIALIKNWPKTSSNLNLIIAGWGDPALAQETLKACENTPNAFYVGAAFGERKHQLLSDAKYFILPSLGEGMPMAVLEAISYGLIPLITAHCNLDALIEQKYAVKIADDFSDLEQKLQHLESLSSEEIMQWQLRLLEHSTRYQWTKIAEEMLSFYYEITRNSHHVDVQ